MTLPGIAAAALALLAAAIPGPGRVGAAAQAGTLRIVALGDSTTATARDWAPSITEVCADCLPRALAANGIAATARTWWWSSSASTTPGSMPTRGEASRGSRAPNFATSCAGSSTL